jgi:lycopene cyclase domain-containing protein
MDNIYLILILTTPLFPIFLSFDNRVAYFKNWKWSILSALIIAIPYLIWDEIFTENAFWGFNRDYLLEFYIGNLPIEEISFFIVVPFACTFIYECVKYYFRNLNLKYINIGFYIAFFAYALIVGEAGLEGWYTRIAISLGLILAIYLFIKREKYKYLPIAFLLSMIPFLLVNGILTGSFIDTAIVFYNPEEFSNLRIFTIPMEDVVYGFGLIVLNIILFEGFKKRFVKA